MNEYNAIVQKRGKWSQKNIPHKGWICIDIEDLQEPTIVCEMCESQLIRYVHHMKHPDYSEELCVGCICAGHMEQDLKRAKRRDDYLKSRASKRNRWLSKEWKISTKGNDYLIVDGFVITVFKKNGYWTGCVQKEDGSFKKYSSRKYENCNQIKLACFDLITKLLADDK